MRRTFNITVAAAAAVSGAAVMVVEVAGAHMLAPGFGTGLYAWGAMITVTLGALAVGYAAGGRAADRWKRGHSTFSPAEGTNLQAGRDPNGEAKRQSGQEKVECPLFPEAGPGEHGKGDNQLFKQRKVECPLFPLLAGLLAVGAAGCVVDALVWRPLVLHLAGLGGRAGAVLAAAALFAVPLAALGAVYPVAVRLRTQRVEEVGRRAGGLSAISTLGSLVGAALAGFVLVPSLAIETVFAGAAAALLLAAGAVALSARRRVVGAVLVLLAAGPAILPDRPLPAGVLCRRGSLFGPIEVWQEGPLRYLMVARTCQAVGMGDPPRPYMSHVNLISGMLRRSLPSGGSTKPGETPAVPQAEVLVIGLGAGFMPRQLDPISCRSVEIDPAIVAVAEEYFAFDRARWPVTIADGRAFLAAAHDRYGAVVIDAFAGMDLPFQLFTRECFELVRRRLRPDGLLVINFEGYFGGGDDRLARAIERTLREVFPAVDIAVHEKQPGYGSVVFAAHAGGAAVRWPPQEPDYLPRRTLLDDRDATLLTDSRNPVALWSARLESRQRLEQLP